VLVCALAQAMGGIRSACHGSFYQIDIHIGENLVLQVGLNSVLGGALFVTSVVAGSVSLAVQLYSQERSRVRLDFCCFLRDMGFFFFTLGILCAIIVAGEINFWKSVAYASIYVVYGISVAAFEYMKTSACIKRKYFVLEPLLAGMGTPPSPPPLLSLFLFIYAVLQFLSRKVQGASLSFWKFLICLQEDLFVTFDMLGVITELGACCEACDQLTCTVPCFCLIRH